MKKIITMSLAVVALALIAGCATDTHSKTTKQTMMPGPTTTTTTDTTTD